MPTYDYQCRKCRKRFSQAMTIAEHEKARVKCPKCGSTAAQQLFSSILVKTGKKY